MFALLTVELLFLLVVEVLRLTPEFDLGVVVLLLTDDEFLLESAVVLLEFTELLLLVPSVLFATTDLLVVAPLIRLVASFAVEDLLLYALLLPSLLVLLAYRLP